LARSLITLLFAVAYFGPCIRLEGMGIYFRPGPERESVTPHFVSAVRDSQPFGNEPSCSSRNGPLGGLPFEPAPYAADPGFVCKKILARWMRRWKIGKRMEDAELGKSDPRSCWLS
jgi:hypothetical protein